MTTRSISTLVGLPPRPARISVGGVWAAVRTMIRARETRRLLAEMDGRMLADIGVSPAQAHMEASRPFWDVSGR